MLKKVNQWSNIIQYTLLPPICILCETKINLKNRAEKQLDLCLACQKSMLVITNSCDRCASLLEFKHNNLTHILCGKCQTQPPLFDKVYAAFQHRGASRYLINQFKFNHAHHHTRTLAHLLAQHLKINCQQWPQVIIPVPLHPKRYQERGFNQTLEIAKQLSTELNISLENQYCIRNKETEHQINLTAKKRQHNVKNAFTLIKKPTAKHIAIIDDVLTTGATANELASLFKNSGVERVDIWVYTRGIKH